MRVFLKMVMIRFIVDSRMSSGTFLDIFAQFQGILNFILVSEVPILYDNWHTSEGIRTIKMSLAHFRTAFSFCHESRT